MPETNWALPRLRLNKTRGKIMSFMLQRQRDRNRAPTVREIAAYIDKSVGTTHYHLSCMKEMGIVTMKSPRKMWAAETRRPYYAEDSD